MGFLDWIAWVMVVILLTAVVCVLVRSLRTLRDLRQATSDFVNEAHKYHVLMEEMDAYFAQKNAELAQAIQELEDAEEKMLFVEGEQL